MDRGHASQVTQLRQPLLDLGVLLGGVGEFTGVARGRTAGAAARAGRESARTGGHRRSRFEDLGQDAAVHVVGDRDAEQVEHRRGDVEQRRLLRLAPGRNAGPDAIRIPSIRWSPVGPNAGEMTWLVVKSCRPIVRYRQSREHDGQVGGEGGVRAVVELLALVDVLDQRLARLGMRDRLEAGLQVVEQRRGRPRGRRSPAAAGP